MNGMMLVLVAVLLVAVLVATGWLVRCARHLRRQGERRTIEGAATHAIVERIQVESNAIRRSASAIQADLETLRRGGL